MIGELVFGLGMLLVGMWIDPFLSFYKRNQEERWDKSVSEMKEYDGFAVKYTEELKI